MTQFAYLSMWGRGGRERERERERDLMPFTAGMCLLFPLGPWQGDQTDRAKGSVLPGQLYTLTTEITLFDTSGSPSRRMEMFGKFSGNEFVYNYMVLPRTCVKVRLGQFYGLRLLLLLSQCSWIFPPFFPPSVTSISLCT